jgi:hypothetical protein
MIAITKLAQICDELAPYVEKVSLKGHESASFLYVVNKGRAVEISEDNGGFWLEFWVKGRRRRCRASEGIDCGQR